MNEQIKHLVDMTAVIIPGVYTIEYESGKKGVEFNEEALNKFAELIIRECSGFVYNYPEKYLTRNQAREICLSMEEYFGVKEE